MITTENQTLILENQNVKLVFSLSDGRAISAFDQGKKRELPICHEKPLCYLLRDKETECYPLSLSYADGVLSAQFDDCCIKIAVTDEPDYFTFEVLEGLPENFFEFVFVYFKLDTEDVIANGIAMTVQTRMIEYPNRLRGKGLYGSCMKGLEPIGAKMGVVVASREEQRDILKAMMETIDPAKGIVSKAGGPWGSEFPGNSGNYAIVFSMDPAVFQKHLPSFVKYGVNQLDFHQGYGFGQGDFAFFREGGPETFKREIADPMKEHGISCGFHTYAMYIRYEAVSILSDPMKQKQLDYKEVFTLSEDIDESTTTVPTTEDVSGLSLYYGFFAYNSPFLLIDEEIIHLRIENGRFVGCERGCCGTKAAFHRKGSRVIHLVGYFNMFAPRVNTPLFLEIAKGTAEAYNRGGFDMIYLDALDGLGQHCQAHEVWYYAAKFIHEIVRNCNHPPVMEYSMFGPTMWAARGRIGAWDTPYRGYKDWNRLHAKEIEEYTQSYMNGTLGWYHFYPTTENYPGNLHTKYQFVDAMDVKGSLMVGYGYGTVFNPLPVNDIQHYPALRRNLERIKEYMDAKDSGAVSEQVREKLRDLSKEYRLSGTVDGVPQFVEMFYDHKKLYQLYDNERNVMQSHNPFAKQTPFVRIEASLSSCGENPLTLLSLDENKELREQNLTRDFGSEWNVTDRLAMKVRICGNNSKDAVCFRTVCASNSEHGFGDYIIPLDFEGWREFILVETDNGELSQYPFDKPMEQYPLYRSSLNQDRLTGIQIYLSGACEGVYMSDVVACRHLFNPIKNPTVEIGEEKLRFDCELMSTEYLEYDGEKAYIYDRRGYAKEVTMMKGSLSVESGDFEAHLTADGWGDCPARAILTLGFTGEIVR